MHRISYRSRFDDDLDCWAVFRKDAISRVSPVELLVPSDPDLVETLQLFGLAS